MVYKRATRALKEAGIEHIRIVKSLWGSAPEDDRAIRQSSKCFDTWQEARDAVLDGYRPTVEEWKPGFEDEALTSSVLEEFKLALEQDDMIGFLEWLSTLPMVPVVPDLAKRLCNDLNEALPDENRHFVIGSWGYICLKCHRG